MTTEKILNKKSLTRVYFLFDELPSTLNKKTLATKLTSQVYKKTIKFADPKAKKYLKEYIQSQLPDNKKDTTILPAKNKILKIVKETLSKCQKEIPTKTMQIFILPTFNQFVKDKMQGINGFSPWKNTLILNIHPDTKNWEASLKKVLCHEYNHAVAYNFNKANTLLENLILEGLAEHFREKAIGGNKALWTKAVPKKTCKKYFPKIKEKLNSKSYKLHKEIFFTSKKYPPWLGYSLGYQIVKSFLKKNKRMPWTEIIKLKPEEILQKSDFSA